MRHGGKVLIDQLKIQGVKRVFCIPGESYLAALDGLFESDIETIVGRHEGGVTMMAEAYGKLTGKPGVAFVTRGPGATNACSGVHVAFQDSTPLVLLIGQVFLKFVEYPCIVYHHFFQLFLCKSNERQLPDQLDHSFLRS